MAVIKSVWGIDIGQCALKALKLSDMDGRLQAEAIDAVEYPKVLSKSDPEREQIIRDALAEFFGRNDCRDSLVVIGVPGQTSFTRFVKMPPVETKNIPNLVKFEAEQQIPFDIREVIWRWQTFSGPDDPEVEVGLFAIKRTDVYAALQPFVEQHMTVDVVQMAPMALYNFMACDKHVASEGATLLVDIGADSTDLVVADGSRVWTRTIQLGGNRFTEALVKSFKLSFEKAESLKRSAGTSKYAKQVFQAMRPVFADLAQEIQRSIGFYTSQHRDSRLTRVVGMGNGFRLPGLQKYLQQNLTTEVVRVDGFNNLQPSGAVSASALSAQVLGMGVAYGLALQGLGIAPIETNLVPDEIVSTRRWRRKRPWFAAAAALLVAATLAMACRARNDYSVVQDESQSMVDVRNAMADWDRQVKEYRKVEGEGETELMRGDAMLKVLRFRGFWPNFFNAMSQSIQSALPDHPRLAIYDEDAYQELWKPDERRRKECLSIVDMQVQYVPDLSQRGAADLLTRFVPVTGRMRREQILTGMARPHGDDAAASAFSGRGFRVFAKVRCPMNGPDARVKIMRLKDESERIIGTHPKIGEHMKIIAAEVFGVDKPPTVMPGFPAGRAPAFGTGEFGSSTAEDDAPKKPIGPVDVFGQSINPTTYRTARMGWVIQIVEDPPLSGGSQP